MQIKKMDLIVTYTDGEKENVGRVVGEKGDKGERGRTGTAFGNATSNITTLPEDSILYLASIAPSIATYTGDKITLLTYSDFQGITSHTKALNYTGEQLTQTVENFVYNSQIWTVDITLTYSAGIWQSKNVNISKV